MTEHEDFCLHLRMLSLIVISVLGLVLFSGPKRCGSVPVCTQYHTWAHKASGTARHIMLKTAQPVAETPTSLRPHICSKGWRWAESLLGPVSASVCATRSVNLVLCPWCFRDQLRALFLVLAPCSQGQARSDPMNTSACNS